MAATRPAAPIEMIATISSQTTVRMARRRVPSIARHRSIGFVSSPSSRASSPDRSLLAAMPKAELHLHLDGSLRIETALELARTRGVDAPRNVEGMRAELVAPMPCHDQ